MLPKALLAAALATSTASAFLLPPPTGFELENADNSAHPGTGDFRALPVDAARDRHGVASPNPFYHEFTEVKVACPGCPLSVRNHKHHKGDDDGGSDDGKVVTISGVPNHIPLYFSIDHAAEHDRLLVNGFELYPDVDIYNGVLSAVQVPDRHHRHHGKGKHHHENEEEEKADHRGHDEADEHDEMKKRRRHHEEHGAKAKNKEHKEHKHHKDGKHAHRKHAVNVPLGYSLQMHAVGKDASNGMEVVALSLQIIEVNNVFVQGIPAVSIRLIRTPEGGLMIGRIDVEETEKESDGKELSHHGHGNDDRMASLKKQLEECSNVFCKWKAMVAASLQSHGCKGKAMHHGKAEHGEKNGDGGEARHHHHHHHQHHKLLEHSWSELLKKLGSHILFPVLIGITAGVVVSLVGMLVGTVVVGFWRLVFRRRQAAIRAHHHHRHRHSRNRNSSNKVVQREQGADEEKAGLIATTEPVDSDLPLYQDQDPKTNA